MKKTIAILGSTGSIGKTTLNIIRKDINKFEIILLTTNSNLKELSKQIKLFKPKNFLINHKSDKKIKKKNLNNLFINFLNLSLVTFYKNNLVGNNQPNDGIFRL